MRHKVYGKHLGRNKNQRTALFKSLVQALLVNGSIQTTEPKAKAIKGTVDKIINQAKSKDTQRLLQSFFAQKPIKERLIKEIAPAMKDRTSGYTSVVKLGVRPGDGAMMVRMSLIGIAAAEPVSKPAAKNETKETDKVEEVKAEAANVSPARSGRTTRIASSTRRPAKRAPRKAAK